MRRRRRRAGRSGARRRRAPARARRRSRGSRPSPPPSSDGGREHARGVARVDAGLLDVLHDGGDVRLLAVAERVDVDLDRVLEEAVDEDAAGRVRHRSARRPPARSRRAWRARRGRTRDERAPGSRRARRPRAPPRAILDDPPLRAADARAARAGRRSAHGPRPGRSPRTACRGCGSPHARARARA